MRNETRFRLAPLAFVLTALSVASPGRAQAPFYGSRATGMAGAATAAVQDGMALWINPAALAGDGHLDVEAYGSAVATDNGNLREAASSLSGADLAAAAADPNARRRLVEGLSSLLEPGTGVVGSGSAGAGVAWKGFALGIDDTPYAGVYPFVDLTHVQPGSDPETSIAHNETAIRSAGLQAREVRLGLSHAFFSKLLELGVSLRYIDGRTTYANQSVFTIDFGNPMTVARQALTANPLDSSRFTFDAGAIVNLFGIARVGIVSTAINAPSFPVQQDPSNPELSGAPASLTLPRTLRAGGSVTVLHIVTVAVDGDLIRTDTLVPGGQSQQLSGGIEVNLPLFVLRGGAFYDFAAVDPHWAYSAGFGIDLPFVSLAGAVVLSTYHGLSLSSANQRDVGAALSGRFRF